MSEKHKNLKVLTKQIIWAESLNALVSNISINSSMRCVFSIKYELWCWAVIPHHFFHVQICLQSVLCHDLCTNFLCRSFVWWLGVHLGVFPEPTLCVSKDLLLWSLFSHAWLDFIIQYLVWLVAHLCGLQVMHLVTLSTSEDRKLVQRSWHKTDWRQFWTWKKWCWMTAQH